MCIYMYILLMMKYISHNPNPISVTEVEFHKNRKCKLFIDCRLYGKSKLCHLPC